MFLPTMDPVDGYSVKIVTISCVFTGVYLPLLVLFLIYLNDLYLIGKFSSLFVPGLIVAAEVFKLYLCSLIETPRNHQRRLSKLKLREIYKSFGCILIVILVYYALAVLFGAPILSKNEETLMLSILVASMTVIPSCLNVGADQTISFLIGRPDDNNLINNMIRQSIQLTFLGTWSGAIVIPLDWDRPWQEWPVSCAIGAIAGHLLSHIIMIIKLLPNIIKVFTGKTLKFYKFCNKSKLNLYND